jgi:hypothetical protein
MAANLVDMSGYRLSTGAVLDRIAFHAYGRPRLLFELLRQVYTDVSDCGIPRSGSIGRAQVDNALCSQAYRHALRTTLLGPVEEFPKVSLVLASALICFRVAETSEVPFADIQTWLTSEEIPISPREALSELHTLREMGLLEVNQLGDVTFSLYGGGGELTSLIDDVATFFTQMKSRFSGETAR